VNALLFCLIVQLTPAHIARVIDGDTAVLWAFSTPPEERIRILGVDTPERGQPNYVEAARFTAHWLAQGPFTLETCKRDSFGRYLSIVTRGADTLAAALVQAGLGTAYP
jgi:Staphylococcus phage endonuclease